MQSCETRFARHETRVYHTVEQDLHGLYPHDSHSLWAGQSVEVHTIYRNALVLILKWWLICIVIIFHFSTQGNGMPWPRRIQKAFSFRITSLLNTLLRKMAQWQLLPRAGWSFLGKLSYLIVPAAAMRYSAWGHGWWSVIAHNANGLSLSKKKDGSSQYING